MKRKVEALVNMAYLGQCYKTDLALMLRKGKRYESEVQKALIDSEWIREKEVTKSVVDSRNPKVAVVAITNKGKVHLCDMLDTDKYITPAFNQTKFNINDVVKLNRYLGDSRIIVMMHKANIRAYPYEKPSLYHLYMHLSHEAELFPEKYNDEHSAANEYNNSLDVEKVLNDGVFYSVNEFRQFVRCKLEARIEDSFQGSRFRGILVTKDQIIIVYLANVFDNKRIKLTSGQEERGIKIIESVFSKLNQVEEANALVISSGNSLVVDMAICGYNGVVTPKYKSFKTLFLLDNSCDKFSHIYVIPHNLAGVDSLSYIAHHTFEEWAEDSRDLFGELDNFELIPDEYLANPWLLARDKNMDRRAIFIPYYDVKLLGVLHDFHEEVSVVTYADMADTISHCLRRETAIYDVDGNLLPVQYYQQSGRPVGSTYINKEKNHKVSFKHIGVNISADEKKKIEKITRANGTSVSAYIRKLIRMHLNEDYEEFERLQKKEKLERKK